METSLFPLFRRTPCPAPSEPLMTTITHGQICPVFDDFEVASNGLAVLIDIRCFRMAVSTSALLDRCQGWTWGSLVMPDAARPEMIAIRMTPSEIRRRLEDTQRMQVCGEAA